MEQCSVYFRTFPVLSYSASFGSDLEVAGLSMASYFCSSGRRRTQRDRNRVAPKESGLPTRSVNQLSKTLFGFIDAFQTINNACASVALLNIVNNIPSVELGGNLREFKSFTKNFSPALRGDAIANFEFVKEIHNSFARYVTENTSFKPC